MVEKKEHKDPVDMGEKNEEKKSDELVEIPVSKYLESMRKNPWIVSTIVLGVFIIILVVLIVRGNINGISENAVSTTTIGQQAVNFINNGLLQGQATVTLDSVTEKSGLYEVLVNYNGQKIPSYFTKDGKYFVGTQVIDTSLAAISGSSKSAKEVPKSDKPVADFFVFTYCPYGTQMEKALVPVYNLLKNKADINIVFIGAMHGEYEKTESLRQLCIQKNYGKDKLFAYLDKFLVSADIGNCQGTDSCVNPLIDNIYLQIGVDKNTVNACMSSADAEAMYQADVNKASSLGISSSPSVVINGVETSVGRSPALVQKALCSAFNTEPSECSQNLSSVQASAGFGSTGSSSSAASCG